MRESATFDVFFHGYQPKDGDTVVEVGAGTGYETQFLSHWVGENGLVIAIEANPDEFNTMLTVCYGRTNIKFINAAALDYIGEAQIFRDGQRSFIHEHDQSIPVQAATLDLLCEDLPKIDFLKMNIEGSEIAALKGFAEGLQRTANAMVSCHDFFGMPTHAEVWQLLSDAGFEVSRWDEAAGAWARDYIYAHRDL
jgi:FkbM family methyltransferase